MRLTCTAVRPTVDWLGRRYVSSVVDIPTVATSLIASLIASYIGVRYFTGPQLRAEQATLARRAIRDLVSPLRRDVREFRNGMRRDLRRDGSAHPADGMIAQQILLLAHDLPPLSRRRTERRLDEIFGTGWMRLARLRDATVPDADSVSASYMTMVSLLDNRKEGEPRRSYVDGLLQRALTAGPDSQLTRRLEQQLILLERGR
jgi:hypothetical protein